MLKCALEINVPAIEGFRLKLGVVILVLPGQDHLNGLTLKTDQVLDLKMALIAETLMIILTFGVTRQAQTKNMNFVIQ